MRRTAGFTLIEMTISTALFAAGAVYIYGTFAGVTTSTANATISIDLSSQNKKAMTALYNELQASSLGSHDIDDSGVQQAVFTRIADDAAPAPATAARIVTRTFTAPVQDGEGNWGLGEAKVQSREKTIALNSQITFRKVVGYRFNAGAGSILPEWSPQITYRVNARRKLVRTVEGGRTRTVAAYVDAFDVETRVDGTVIITLITAKRRPAGGGWVRYANTVTIHPKN